MADLTVTDEAARKGLVEAAKKIQVSPGPTSLAPGDPFRMDVEVPGTMQVDAIDTGDLPGTDLHDEITTTTLDIEATVELRVRRRTGGRDAREDRDVLVLPTRRQRQGDRVRFELGALFAPALVPMTDPATELPARWTVEPVVTLSADPPPEGGAVTLPAAQKGVPVETAALAVPTVLLVCSERKYGLDKDGGRLVVVPPDSALRGLHQGSVRNLNRIVRELDGIRGIIAKLDGFAGAIGWVAGLPRGLQLLGRALERPRARNHKLVFASRELSRDLGDPDQVARGANEWRDIRFRDDHGAEDDIDSLLLVAIDRAVELFESADFKGGRYRVLPSPDQHWIGVPDFRDMREVVPDGASVRRSRGAGTDFSDRAHSFRYQPQRSRVADHRTRRSGTRPRSRLGELLPSRPRPRRLGTAVRTHDVERGRDQTRRRLARTLRRRGRQ